MRAIVKEVHDERLTVEAELLLMYASRSSWSKPALPALAEGIWVVGTGTISPPRLTRVAGAALMPISSEPSRAVSATCRT